MGDSALNILFSKDHVWLKDEGETVSLGISDYAQEKLGSVMFLNLPEVGDAVSRGKKFGDVESIKTVTDLISPVSGEVVEMNEELIDGPDAINVEPYDAWFIKIKNADVPDGLMQEQEYEEYCKTL